MATKLIYLGESDSSKLSSIDKLVVIGDSTQIESKDFIEGGLKTLLSKWEYEGGELTIDNLTHRIKNKKSGPHHAPYGKGDQHFMVSIGSLATTKSRSNAVIRADLIPNLVAKLIDNEENAHIALVVDEDQAFAAGCAVARAFPQYSRKASFLARAERTIEISFVNANCTRISNVDPKLIQATADGIRLTARLTDTPCSELNTTTYIEEVQRQIDQLPEPSKVKTTIIKGEDLEKGGFGGLWGVGKAAVHLPALVILSYEPVNPSDKRLALVGKGICYDTGGLSLKSTTSMPTMKTDMGGSAAILSSFLALVKTNSPHTIYALLCLAENSVDKLSTRPDDILTMYSGKTVEVNNTDAEGRLVLGDGVAYATKDLSNITHVIDMATLTGAQTIATGPRHAGLLTNVYEFEGVVQKAAHSSGDMVFPLIYSPEFLMKELDSEVADMKNSNKNGPTTAASSLAGHFIEAHLHPDYKGIWCHLDIAGPATKGGRATGYGVALLVELVNKL